MKKNKKNYLKKLERRLIMQEIQTKMLADAIMLMPKGKKCLLKAVLTYAEENGIQISHKKS